MSKHHRHHDQPFPISVLALSARRRFGLALAMLCVLWLCILWATILP